MILKQLTLAARNLGRNRRRNLATASAIVLGYAGLILLSGFINRIENFLRATSIYLNHVGTISIYKPDGVSKHLLQPDKYSISGDEQKKIIAAVNETLPHAEAVSATLEGFTLIGNGCRTWPVRILGIDPQVEKRFLSHPAVLEFSNEVLASRRGTALWRHGDISPVVVTGKVARNLGKSRLREIIPGKTEQRNAELDCASPDAPQVIDSDTNVQLAARTFSNHFSAIDAEIVGNFASGLELLEESAALLPIADLQRLYETDAVTKIEIYLPWNEPPEAATEQLRNQLKRMNLDFEVHNYKSLLVNPFYAGFMSLIYVMSGFFLALAVAVVSFTVSDTMTMSVLERTREIGTLRAIGFRQQDIIRLFSLEGSLLALLCLPVGLALAVFTSTVVNARNFMFEIPGVASQIKVTLATVPSHCVLIGLLLMIVTTLSGWLTSRKTSKQSVVHLLYTQVS